MESVVCILYSKIDLNNFTDWWRPGQFISVLLNEILGLNVTYYLLFRLFFVIFYAEWAFLGHFVTLNPNKLLLAF